ncbi:MAG: hydroxymethylbilane synthase [Solirubrobacterales bacterium]|nr:hydroxymethylbilane synthase [Solirubrobacterales bacterium]
MRTLRVATRSSALALAQAEAIAQALGGAELVPVRTADAEVGDKARFVRGVERAVIDGAAELAVHSAKDVPADTPDELALVGVPGRADPGDAFLGAARSLAELERGARIGTASLRRRSQLLALRPDLEVAELRGNVDTRLGRLAAGDYDGIVLAAAGLVRLGRDEEISFRFSLTELTPAPGQGCLAIQARRDDPEVGALAARISDRAALTELTAERSATVRLRASCDTPVGICARVAGSELELLGYAGLPDGSEWVRDRIAGDPEQPAALGEALAERMIAAGAAQILERAGVSDG